MPGRDVIASPVLVGRDEPLAIADLRLSQTAAGRGHLLLLSGEAGIGKTRLLSSISRRALRADFTVVRAAAFQGDAEDSGGVLLDLASDLRRATPPAAQAIGRALADRLRGPMTAEGDQHRQRRLLVQDLVDLVSDLDATRRWLIVLEDLHWADELSLEVVAHLAARLALSSTLVVGAFRSDELFPGTPMRDWRTRLVSQRLAEEVRLQRLPLEQTATLTSSLLSRPAPAQLVAAIQARTDGIPLHIEELLAGADDDALDRLASPDGANLDVPQTLSDAVLLRVHALDDCSRGIAGAAAVIGRSFDFDLLVEVTEADDETVDRCLRALRSSYLIQAGSAPDSFDFRHSLVRDALYAELPLPRRRRLHERVAVVASERGYRDAFVSAHFEHAGRSGPAHRHALRAAVEASSVSAHREALQLYRRSLRNRPADQGPQEHARLLALLGTEAAAVDENVVAAEAFELAHAEWKGAGDLIRAAAVVPQLVAVHHVLGHPLEARVRLLETALADVRGVEEAAPVEAQLLGSLAAAYMLHRELDLAIAYGERGRTLSRSIGNDEASLNTTGTLGSVLVFAGQLDSGWALLEDSVTRSEERYLESEAARGYRMIGTVASVVVEYDRAEWWLDRGIEYAAGAELWNHRSYMTAHRAHVHWARGEWALAQQTAEQALADGRAGVTTRITALYVLGYLALGRAQFTTATQLLSEALDAGSAMGELQRVSPALWGLAEAAQLQGDFDRAVALCERGFAASERVKDAAYLYPFLVTGARAHLAQCDPRSAEGWVTRVERALLHRSIPGTLPAIDHAHGLLQLAAGDSRSATASLQRAHRAWQARHRFWEGSWAALELARGTAPGEAGSTPALVAEVRGRAEAIGATPLVTAADAVQQRASATQPWHPLTAREFSVATLVSAGLTNREIATELFVSPRTVSAHVEHILTKLGAGRRAEIAAWAARISA